MGMLLRRHRRETGEKKTLPAPGNEPKNQEELPVKEAPKKKGRPKKGE